MSESTVGSLPTVDQDRRFRVNTPCKRECPSRRILLRLARIGLPRLQRLDLAQNLRFFCRRHQMFPIFNSLIFGSYSFIEREESLHVRRLSLRTESRSVILPRIQSRIIPGAGKDGSFQARTGSTKNIRSVGRRGYCAYLPNLP